MLCRVAGVSSADLLERLALAECPALSARRRRQGERAGEPWEPIVWAEAQGSRVVDADGHAYVDLTSGFGACLLGHRHPGVVAAVQAQSERLLHALGDLYSSDTKIRFVDRLARMAPFDNARVILGLHGSDAVDAALKTAALATGKAGVLAFAGSYHGLFMGPLAVSHYQPSFREPFAAKLARDAHFAPWPSEVGVEASLAAVRRCLRDHSEIGAVIVEPIQGRGGMRTAPEVFFCELRRLCREANALLIVDEILTGLGRCGRLFHGLSLSSATSKPSADNSHANSSGASNPGATNSDASNPSVTSPGRAGQGYGADILCLGKALGSGMPVSACIASLSTMAAWGEPGSEAMHTATFIGHPLGCAAGLATLESWDEPAMPAVLARESRAWQQSLTDLAGRHPQAIVDLRGCGLMWGIELQGPGSALVVLRKLLRDGFLVLAAGQQGNVLQVLPNLAGTSAERESFVAHLDALLSDSRFKVASRAAPEQSPA